MAKNGPMVRYRTQVKKTPYFFPYAAAQGQQAVLPADTQRRHAQQRQPHACDQKTGSGQPYVTAGELSH